jgi:hypothetical protein
MPERYQHHVQAALQNTRIPLVEVGTTEDPDEEPELELDDDPANAKHVDVSRLPIIVTICQAMHCPKHAAYAKLAMMCIPLTLSSAAHAA